MKPVTSHTVVLTGIIISIALVILTSYHLGGLEFFNRIMPVIVLSISAYYSHILDRSLVDLNRDQNKFLAVHLTECVIERDILKIKLLEVKCKK